MIKVIKISGILFLLCILACTSHKPLFKSKTKFPYTESEFNVIVAFELLKKKHRLCTGNCDFSIDNQFYYFDTCAMVYLEHIKIKKSLFNRKIEVPPGRYYVENFGTLTVYPHKEGDIPDFIFAPIYYSKKENVIYGQLKYKDGRREYFSFNIIKNEIYFRWSSYYYKDCSMDFDSY